MTSRNHDGRMRRTDRNNTGQITRREHGGAWIPLGKRTSTRCRATHDTPWSLRCTQPAGHDGEHTGRGGRRW